MRSVALSLVCLLQACAIVPKAYVPPASGDVATLRVVNLAPGYLVFAMYEDPAECRNRALVKPHVQPSAQQTVQVAAGRPLAFTLSLQVNRLACHMTPVFTPQTSGAYIARVHVIGENCVLTFGKASSLGDPPSKWEPVSYETREWQSPWDEAGPFCVKVSGA